MTARATWKGSLNVSLVSLNVKAYTATESEAEPVQLHQLHAACRGRIRYQRICEQHGPVSGDEIVMGYEHARHEHVVIDLDELDQLRSSAEMRAIRIDTFVAAGIVAPLQLTERCYYILPDGPLDQLPYQLVVQAMIARKVEAVAQVVLAKREQLVLLRPLPQGLLSMTVLKYAAQVRSPEQFTALLTPLRAPIAQEERGLAESLIDARTERKFDFSRYQDRYGQQLRALVEAKVTGQSLQRPAENEPQQILSLLEALRASVAQQPAGPQVHEKLVEQLAAASPRTKKTTRAARTRQRSA